MKAMARIGKLCDELQRPQSRRMVVDVGHHDKLVGGSLCYERIDANADSLGSADNRAGEHPRRRARVAKLRHPASVEDVNYQSPRGLDRALFLKLAACDWIAERRNLLGLGKSWLACALGHKACRENMSVLYTRAPRLFADLAIAHGDARYARLLRSLARVKLFILDDWGPEALTPDQARDLLEIVEDRYDKGSLIITSQVPVDRWHDLIGVPTLADAILDRVIHNAYRIDLAGESLRKRRSSP